jgi:hypothetical protein
MSYVYCERCYMQAIEKLCAGYVITGRRGEVVRVVPPLPPWQAAQARRAARVYADARESASRAETARHPHHQSAA